MKSKIKFMFGALSDEKTYKKEIFRLIIIILIGIVIVLMDTLLRFLNIIDLNSVLFIRIIYLSTFIILGIMVFFSLCRMINISDYIDKEKRISGKKKYKFSPIKFQLDDIILLFEQTDIIWELDILTPNNKIVILEVRMDFQNDKNILSSKEFCINDRIYKSLHEFKVGIINDNICDDYHFLNIQAIDEVNNPKLLKKVIDSYKR